MNSTFLLAQIGSPLYYWMGGVLALLILGYLLYALFKPEKF